MVKVKQIEVGGYDRNFVYFIEEKGGVAIVDPSNAPLLISTIESEGLKPKMILLTHSHFDHTEGVAELVNRYQLPVYCHYKAASRIEIPSDVINLIDDGDVIDLSSAKVKVLYTPGHIDDAVCYYIDAENAADAVPKLLTGDTLFVGGCGRADLENSDISDLYKSLQRIKALPGETVVYSGHNYGPTMTSTLGWEKDNNKYLLCKDFEEFQEKRG